MCLCKALKITAKKDIKLAGILVNRGLETNDIQAIEVGLSALIEGLGVLKAIEKQKKVSPANIEKKGG